jgi:hypothetical protein
MNDDYTDANLINSKVKTISGIYSNDYTGIITQLINGIGQTIAVIKTNDGRFR